MSKRKIITIFYGDLSSPQGPMIHYTELWNSFHDLYKNEFEMEGWFMIKKGAPPIMPVRFPVKPVYVPGFLGIPVLPGLYYDFMLACRLFKHRKQIIYSRHWFYPLFTTLIIKALNIKIVYELNSISKWDAIKNKVSRLKRWVFAESEIIQIRNAAGCIAVSEGIQHYAKEQGAKKVVTISNGVAEKFFEIDRTENHGIRKILYVGSFTSWDGTVNISKLAAAFPSIDFILVGDGDERMRVQEACRTLSNVHFKGFVSYLETLPIYKECDAGIVLYDQGRNSMKLSSLKTLEYMAAGLPIFATRVPGQEFIEECHIGLLTDFTSDEELIADFRKFMEKFNELKKTSSQYRMNAGRGHSWKTTAKHTYHFINELWK